MKTIVIIGAGKGLGMSLSKRFGKEGFQVALVARNAEKLQSMVDELKENGVEASYFLADIFHKEQIDEALTDIKSKYGKIDVLEYSPMLRDFQPTSVLEASIENVRYFFEGYVISAMNLVNAVVPDMIKRGEGALLFTTGISSFYTMPQMASASIGGTALRKYLANLHMELSPQGILVANRSLGVRVTAGTGTVNDPDVIADMWYQVYDEKLGGEELYPKGVTPETIVM